jgi:hypothetical protein
MKRLVAVVVMVAVSCALVAAGAQAASTRDGRIRGMVFAHSQSGIFAGGNLTYHNGPVMQTNQVYAIFWIPPGYSDLNHLDPNGLGYQKTIDNYFSNAAHDSTSFTNPPLQTNVYWSDTQYYQTTPRLNVSYNSKFAGEIDDTTTPYPKSGCADSYTSVCLTDAQIQTEIQSVIATYKLPTGGSTEYFVFTPKNVGSCIDSTSSECSFSYYCAYHSNFVDTNNGQQVLYANMPYANFVPSACGSGQKPNGNDADSTINVTSHEHNETITDPFGSAWYDRRGNEDGDKCAWNFGSTSRISGPSGAEYNQTINGTPYYLQQEWSNHSSGCVLSGL